MSQSLSDEALQAAIDAKEFPRVTKNLIEARIAGVEYFVLPGTTTTICNVTMVNGFSVRGESACVDRRNFDEEIGRNIAYSDAFDKLWQLEGYLLAEQRFRAAL